MAVTTKGAGRPLSPRGSGGTLPQKNLESRSSEMRFPAFWASKRVLLMRIFIDHKARFFLKKTIKFLSKKVHFEYLSKQIADISQ